MRSESVKQIAVPETVRIPANRHFLVFHTWLLIIVAILTLLSLLVVGSGATALFLMATAFLVPIVVAIRRMTRAARSPALLADAQGITDDTSDIPGGLVRWEEIVKIEEEVLSGHPCLLFYLRDPEAYMKRLPMWKRMMFASNLRQFGTPCIVGQSSVALPISEVREQLATAQKFHSARSHSLSATSNGSTSSVSTGHWWTSVPPEERKAQSLRQRER